MRPPSITAQEHKVTVKNGKPIIYDPPKLKAARQQLLGHLQPYAPQEPMKGPINLFVTWLFPRGTAHRHGEWKTSKPDTDNLQKLLKDCMTEVGFWKDDAQVARETAEKRWSDDPTGIYIEIAEMYARNERRTEK